jgi:hypothetical protein
VRQAYARELARDGSRSAMHSLVLALASEKNLRATWTIVEMLQELSGQSFTTDPVKWLEWELKLPNDWKAKSSPFSKDAKHTYDTGGPALADMQLLSNRIAFVIDVSDEMSAKLASGKTRKETIEVELRHTLEHLAAGTEFNLIPFGDAPAAFEKGVVPANAGNVKKALAFFKDCKLAGKSNFWDAALLALSDPKIDTILLVSCGETTGGRHDNPELIRALFAERNRFRHVVLDALVVSKGPEVDDAWREMCLHSGGRMKPIEMK